MPSDVETMFYVLKVGALQEEPCAWADIEAMCMAGTLSPEALIFLPTENAWKKVRETELAPLFDDALSVIGEDDVEESTADSDDVEDAYERLIGEIEVSPGDWNLMLQAADLALRRGERDRAIEHFQQALEVSPYHPRIVQEAKRTLRPREWKTLRFFEQPRPVWEDVGEVAGYPFGRGPLYLAIPAIVLAVLFWFPVLRLPAAFVLYLGAVLAARATAAGEQRPPLWHRLLSEPRATLLSPLAAACVVGAELYGPFLLVAQIIVWVNGDGETNLFMTIEKNPIMLVLMSTVSLLYLPAVAVLLATPSASIKRVINPVCVLAAMTKMEREYIATVGLVALLFCVWWGLAMLLDWVPYAGHFVSVALGVYGALFVAFAIGRLCSRFADDFENGNTGHELA